MSKPKTVWMLDNGESYSDWGIVGLYSTEANAKLVQEKLNGKGKISEEILDPSVIAIRKGYQVFRVLMRRDGTTENVEEEKFSAFSLSFSGYLWLRSKAATYPHIADAQDVLLWNCVARSKKHAVKIVNEKRAQMIACGEWK